MRIIFADKIASVAQHNNLGNEIRISLDIPCEEGVLLAVRILNNKSRYNQLELTSGRMSTLKEGDVVIGALGHRNALLGYSGYLPKNLKAGSTIQVLNIGGVIGICDSYNPDVGPPFNCEVLGAVLDFPFLGQRIGVPAKVGEHSYDEAVVLDISDIPIIAIAGTCMDSGKTIAACSLISRFSQLNIKVSACKATGVSLRRDILSMEDAGADATMIFSDFGVVATTPDNGPALTKLLLNQLALNHPDVIVVELGDGLLGSYGVQAILLDQEIKKSLSGIILCANDPVAAWGGVKILREEYKIEPTVVTGPATDNSVGLDLVKNMLNVPAINALTNGFALGNLLAKLISSNCVERLNEN